jgi:hypothetical protein
LNQAKAQVMNGLDLIRVGYVKADYWFYKLIFNRNGGTL